MTKTVKGFRSEAELAISGRKQIQNGLNKTECKVGLQEEVRGPGVTPDLIIYSESNGLIHYVISVEFKLRNWKRALSQAFRHRNFVNEAYVVFDRAKAGPAIRNLPMFKRANVGFVTVDINEVVDVWSIPEPELPFSIEYSHQLATSLIPSNYTSSFDHPFTRTIRGGLALSSLRSLWMSPFS